MILHRPQSTKRRFTLLPDEQDFEDDFRLAVVLTKEISCDEGPTAEGQLVSSDQQVVPKASATQSDSASLKTTHVKNLELMLPKLTVNLEIDFLETVEAAFIPHVSAASNAVNLDKQTQKSSSSHPRPPSSLLFAPAWQKSSQSKPLCIDTEYATVCELLG